MSQRRQQQHSKVCDCGNDSFLLTKDLNLDKVWKAGNKYCRICTDCGNRYFLSKAMYEAASETFVILDGAEKPIPLRECPNCEEEVTGDPDDCPYCDITFAEYDPDDAEDDEDDEPENEFDCPACGTHITGFPEECPNCAVPYDWDN